MNINHYEFDIVLLSLKAALEVEQLRYMKLSGEYDDLSQSHIVHALRNFASSRPVDEYSERTEYTEVSGQPVATPLNYFRLLVTTFCPYLKFGWLKPEYNTKKVPCLVYKNVKSYNLYPLTNEDFRQQFGRRWDVAKATKPDVVQWLTECTPLTAQQRQVNMTNSYEICDDYRDSLNNRYSGR